MNDQVSEVPLHCYQIVFFWFFQNEQDQHFHKSLWCDRQYFDQEFWHQAVLLEMNLSKHAVADEWY